jgi:hypothetical protein
VQIGDLVIDASSDRFSTLFECFKLVDEGKEPVDGDGSCSS